MSMDDRCKCGHTRAEHPRESKCETAAACECDNFEPVDAAPPAPPAPTASTAIEIHSTGGVREDGEGMDLEDLFGDEPVVDQQPTED
jgi:hypothetical protein